jgi:hypothetical protein
MKPTSPLAAIIAVFTCTALTTGVVVLSACSSSQEETAQASPSADKAPASPAVVQAGNKADEKKFEDFDPTSFDRSANVDNPFFPLTPGTRFTYEGTSVEDDGTRVPHRFVMNVTDLTKVVGGVRSAVTWDLDYMDGELVEAELAFFAQDKQGTVWRMGEYPEEYEEGKFVVAPAWLHGIEDARAGIEMKAKPETGTPSYSQGWGPAVNWTDRGIVDQVGQKVKVPAGQYDDVVVIAESSQAEGPDAQQLKFFARGVGNVRVGWRGKGEKTQEVLELVKLEKLDAKGLAEVRAGALKLEKSAYERNKKVYGGTAPLETPSGATTK